MTSAPAAPTDLAISPSTASSPELSDTGLVTLTGTLPEPGLSVDVMDGTTNLGYANVTGTTFSLALDLANGANPLDVTADDGAGNVSPAATLNVFVNETPPQISSLAAVGPNPRNSPVGSIDVTLSKAINLDTFTTANLSLTDDGGPNLITSAVTISLVAGTTATYQIGGLSGLTTAQGTYVLTVNASGIEDAAGNVGTGSMSTSWLMDTTPPTSSVTALPARTTSTSFTVTVTGSDPTAADGGAASGVASIAIYDSVYGGAFVLFTTVTPADPSATFTGQAGHTYGFYSVAVDKAGNVQPTPTAAQATTTVINTPTPTPTPTPPPLVTVQSLQVETIKVGKGKHAKKNTVLVLRFSGAINASSADNANAYDLAAVVKVKAKGKGKHRTPATTKLGSLVSVAAAAYDPSNDSVTLTPRSKLTSSKPEELIVNGSRLSRYARPRNRWRWRRPSR